MFRNTRVQMAVVLAAGLLLDDRFTSSPPVSGQTYQNVP